MQENQTGADNAAASLPKISKELAEKEFVSFCENNKIEHNELEMNDDEKKSFNDIKKRFIDACKQGRVEVNGTSIKYTVCDFAPNGYKGEIIEIKRPSGHAFVAMDGYKDDRSVARLVAFMSAVTGKDTKYFSNIDAADWKFLQDIATLFLSL